MEKICEYCNREFETRVKIGTLEYQRRKYCSKECQDKARIGYKHSKKTKDKIAKTKLKERNPNWQGGRKIGNCVICNKQFEYWGKERKYCSKDCYFKGRVISIDKEALLNLYNKEKKSIEEISKRISIDENVIRRHLKQWNIPIRQAGEYRKGKGSWLKGKKMPEHIRKKLIRVSVDEEKVKEMLQNGCTDVEIAFRLNVSRGVIKRVRKSLGIKNEHQLNVLSYREKENLERYGIAVGNFVYMNCLRLRRNSKKHEMGKWAVCMILAKRGYDFFTEVKTRYGRADVFDFTNKVIYELETNLTSKKKEEKINQLFDKQRMKDIFIFDLSKVPEDGIEMLKYFDKHIL